MIITKRNGENHSSFVTGKPFEFSKIKRYFKPILCVLENRSHTIPQGIEISA